MKRGQLCLISWSHGDPAQTPRFLIRAGGGLVWSRRPPRYGPDWDDYEDKDRTVYFYTMTDVEVFIRRYDFGVDLDVAVFGPEGVITRL